MESSSAAWLPGAIIGAMIVAAVAVLYKPNGQEQEQDDFKGRLPAFSLTERSGKTVTKEDLRGKVWVAAFVFTRCTGPCPSVSATMARLQSEFADVPNVKLVTFTVDPEHDNPEELAEYASRFGADPERWWFLTGNQEEIYTLLREGFTVGVEQNRGSARTPGNEVLHSTQLVVVDKKGQRRGYFSGVPNAEASDGDDVFQANLDRLRVKVASLLREEP